MPIPFFKLKKWLCLRLSVLIFLSITANPSSASAAPALHIRVGPDSNVCGITVPDKKPSGKIGLIVWLHGGMRSSNPAKGADAHRAILPFVDPRDYYLCSPSAFAGQDWLTSNGLGHIDNLIAYMLLHYPVEANKITLVGVSDGSLGVIAYTLNGKYPVRKRLLISSYPQLVIPPESLAGHSQFAQGKWDFIQGGQDRLFPSSAVMPYLNRWKSVYPNSAIHYYPDGEHDFSYYATNAQKLLKSLLLTESAGSGGPGLTVKKP